MPKRSLILAGGGVKVAYQAGVLQVWLDEAGLTFDHADGASGGVFNLAMYCQGMTGKEMADNWRGFPVLRSIGLNWFQLMRFYWSESLDHLRQVPQAGAAQALEARLEEDQRRPASRHLQRLQLQQEPAAGGRAQGDERGPPRRLRDAAHVVRTGDDRRGSLYRRRLSDRCQPDRGDPPRRRRALDRLDREPQGAVEGRLHRHLLPDHRDHGQRASATRSRPHRSQQHGDRRRQERGVRPADQGADAGRGGAAALPRQCLVARVHRRRRAGRGRCAGLVPGEGHHAR